MSQEGCIANDGAAMLMMLALYTATNQMLIVAKGFVP